MPQPSAELLARAGWSERNWKGLLVWHDDDEAEAMITLAKVIELHESTQ